MTAFHSITRVQIRDMTKGGDETNFLGVTAEVSVTDDGRTLKVIIDPHPTKTADDVRAEMAAEWSEFVRRMKADS
jgi:hypothetical protein